MEIFSSAISVTETSMKNLPQMVTLQSDFIAKFREGEALKKEEKIKERKRKKAIYERKRRKIKGK